MQVIFGRYNGERTRGIVTKMNRVKAKVQISENRGITKVGTVWSVPYTMMEEFGKNDTLEDNKNAVVIGASKADEPINYNFFQSRLDKLTLEAICEAYSCLSPENLTCDGELPATIVRQRSAEYTNKLKSLFKVYGRDVSENVAFDWLREKQQLMK